MRFGKLQVTPGFLLLAAWLNYMDTDGVFWLVLAGCTVHELGHLTVLALLDTEIRIFRLTATGAEIGLSGMLTWPEEFAAAFSGPLANLFTAAIACRFDGGTLFAGINLALGCFNLLPSRRLDGGRAVMALLSGTLGTEIGYELVDMLSKIINLCILLTGVYILFRSGNITMALIGIWLCADSKKIEHV